MSKTLLVLVSAFVFFISACSSMGMGSPKYALVIKNVDWPLLELQSLVAYMVPTGLRSPSANGREFYSKHFVLDGPKYKLAGDAAERFTATITVLGDSRPYDIEIFVTREKRVLRASGFDYVEVGHD